MNQALNRDERGQGLVEYIIMTALIAIAAVGVTQILGQNIRGQLGRIARGVSGKEITIEIMKVEEADVKKRKMNDFDAARK